MAILRHKLVLGAALAMLALISSGGCRLGGGGGRDEAQVRLINAVPDAEELSVAVDGQRVWKHSLYRSNTGFQGIAEGDYDVRLDNSGSGDALVSVKSLEFAKDHAYTVLVLGMVHNTDVPPSIRVFDDASEQVPSNKARLRFINAAFGIGPSDVLFNNIVGLKRIGYGQRSEALLLDDGSYDIKVNPAGFVTPSVGPVSLRLESGHSYTLVAMGLRVDGSLALEAYRNN